MRSLHRSFRCTLLYRFLDGNLRPGFPLTAVELGVKILALERLERAPEGTIDLHPEQAIDLGSEISRSIWCSFEASRSGDTNLHRGARDGPIANQTDASSAEVNSARRNPPEASGTSEASSSSARGSANATAADVGLNGMKAIAVCLCNINYMFGMYATKTDKYTCLIIIQM